MTRDDALTAWRAMSDREKDAAVARDVMHLDFSQIPSRKDYYYNGRIMRETPKYTQDSNAAYAVEERIAEMGLSEEYCKMLQHISLPQVMLGSHRDFARYHATPEQRCCAAWVCCKVREGQHE